MKYLIGLMMVTSVALTACGDKEAKHEGVLTDSQEKVLNDAKAVDDKLLNADEERRKKLEEATE